MSGRATDSAIMKAKIDALRSTIADGVEDVLLTTDIIAELLRVALDECDRINVGGRAEIMIRAADRFLMDIESRVTRMRDAERLLDNVGAT